MSPCTFPPSPYFVPSPYFPPRLCPPCGLCPPVDFVPPWTLSPADFTLSPPLPPQNGIYIRQNNKSLAGQFAVIVIVIRGKIRYSGLRTAVALSTVSLVSVATEIQWPNAASERNFFRSGTPGRTNRTF